jgi:hypothetical protein
LWFKTAAAAGAAAATLSSSNKIEEQAVLIKGSEMKITNELCTLASKAKLGLGMLTKSSAQQTLN